MYSFLFMSNNGGTDHDYKRKPTFHASEFDFDPVQQTCKCPAGKKLSKESKDTDKHGHSKAFFKGKLTDCRDCELKTKVNA